MVIIEEHKNIFKEILSNPWMWMGLLFFSISSLILLIFDLNVDTFLIFNNAATHIGGSILWTNMTNLGDPLLSMMFLFPFVYKKPELIWALVFAGIITILINQGLKSIVHAGRPPAVLAHELFTVIEPVYMYRSFPSGHTVTIATIGAIVIFGLKYQWTKWIMLVIPLLVGFSRIALGVHWPIDVTAGLFIGWSGCFFGLYIAASIKIKTNLLTKHIFSGIFIGAGIFGLLFYKTPYENTLMTQRILISVLLLTGIREYYYTVKGDKPISRSKG